MHQLQKEIIRIFFLKCRDHINICSLVTKFFTVFELHVYELKFVLKLTVLFNFIMIALRKSIGQILFEN